MFKCNKHQKVFTINIMAASCYTALLLAPLLLLQTRMILVDGGGGLVLILMATILALITVKMMMKVNKTDTSQWNLLNTKYRQPV